MTDISKIHPPDSPPGRLLLATDLGVRCDRALDRSAQLAREWHAEIVALNVVDPSVYPDRTLAWIGGATDDELMNVAHRQLARDLSGTGMPARVRIVRGRDPETAIRETACAVEADLVVTGIARQETLGQLLLGSTNERLARCLRQPLLVVHARTHGPYRRIVVATDFSAASRQALLTAIAFFPGRDVTLYHAYTPPMSGFSTNPASVGAALRTAYAQCAAFIEGTPLPTGIDLHAVVECGTLVSTLGCYVRKNRVDLVVIGRNRRDGIMNFILGNTAERLLEGLSCDMLIAQTARAP
ncbi:universal stress protein [Aromatoleum petrolei]|uniref:universal stress protein n=1 Tax=Aromatoleum petrolei TaxID=76116 RepID=UPI001AEC0AF5|nr:universal stress protein [Aromatoleum petrolei]QTQ38226.1 Universal stress protein A [Aromatoleum petrolei]